MQHCWTAADFIAYLNEYVKVQSPDVVELLTKQDKAEMSLFRAEALRFAKTEIDFVIRGCCSSPIGNEPTARFPMGKLMVAKGEPEKSWLHAIIASYEEKNGKAPTNVLVFAECCGGYLKGYTSMLRETFLDITWHFPNMHDLYDNFHPEREAECLLRAGYLEIVPATESVAA